VQLECCGSASYEDWYEVDWTGEGLSQTVPLKTGTSWTGLVKDLARLYQSAAVTTHYVQTRSSSVMAHALTTSTQTYVPLLLMMMMMMMM